MLAIFSNINKLCLKYNIKGLYLRHNLYFFIFYFSGLL